MLEEGTETGAKIFKEDKSDPEISKLLIEGKVDSALVFLSGS